MSWSTICTSPNIYAFLLDLKVAQLHFLLASAFQKSNRNSLCSRIFLPLLKYPALFFPFFLPVLHTSIHGSLSCCISLVLFQQPSAYMSLVREDGSILDHSFIQTQPKGTRRQVCHLQCIKLQKNTTSTIYELQINGNEKQHMGI